MLATLRDAPRWGSALDVVQQAMFLLERGATVDLPEISAAVELSHQLNDLGLIHALWARSRLDRDEIVHALLTTAAGSGHLTLVRYLVEDMKITFNAGWRGRNGMDQTN